MQGHNTNGLENVFYVSVIIAVL